MTKKYEIGSKAYIIESAQEITEVTVIKIGSGFYTVKYENEYRKGAIRIRANKLYPDQKTAERYLAYMKKEAYRYNKR